MALFHFSASAPDGTLTRGTISARDRQELIAVLAAQNLFLVSASEEAPLPVPEAPPPPVSPQEHLKRKYKILLMALLVGGMFVSVWLEFFSSRRDPAQQLNEKLALMNATMTRRDIEGILGPAISVEVSRNSARYFVPPNFTLEVQYDKRGGPGRQINRLANESAITVLRDIKTQKH